MSVENKLYGVVTIFFMVLVWVFAGVIYNLTGFPPGFEDNPFFSTFISYGTGYLIIQGFIWKARRDRPKSQRKGSFK
jgi:hypothetical protein